LPLTTETRFQTQVSPWGICVGQTGAGTGLSASICILLCQHHSTNIPTLIHWRPTLPIRQRR